MGKTVSNYLVVDASEVPVKLSEQIAALPVGQAMVIKNKQRGTAMSTVAYWKKTRDECKDWQFITRKKNARELYLVRLA